MKLSTPSRKQWEPVAFASPSLFLIGLVILFPLAYAFYLSLLNFDLSVGPDAESVSYTHLTLPTIYSV